MATEIRLPQLGNTVESCMILAWRKREGEAIAAGETLCEFETDKAVFDISAPEDGTVLGIFFQEGDDVAVLTTIAVIGQPGEDISAFRPLGEAPNANPSPVATGEGDTVAPSTLEVISPAPAAAQPTTDVAHGVSPRARNLAQEHGVNAVALSGSGPQGRVIERDVRAALTEMAPLTPAARAMTAHGYAAPRTGSGLGGRVLSGDMLPAQSASVPAPAYQDLPVKGVRKRIAERMLNSLHTTAQLTLNSSADATVLNGMRARLKESGDPALAGITINDLLLFAIARVLARHAQVNAHFLGDTIRQFNAVHLGLAVDTPRGLLVPVIHHADTLSLTGISREAKRLARACQENTVVPDELSGGTFTVTNLGTLGIESFTPVLNAPEVGILGVCAVQLKPVARGSEVAFVPHLGLSLTFNHQALDGAPAARFLQDIVKAIAALDVLLVSCCEGESCTM